MWISTVHSEEKLASQAQFYSVRKKTMKEGHGLPEADRKIRQTFAAAQVKPCPRCKIISDLRG